MSMTEEQLVDGVPLRCEECEKDWRFHFDMIDRRAHAALTRTSIRPYYPRYGGRKEQTHG